MLVNTCSENNNVYTMRFVVQQSTYIFKVIWIRKDSINYTIFGSIILE